MMDANVWMLLVGVLAMSMTLADGARAAGKAESNVAAAALPANHAKLSETGSERGTAGIGNKIVTVDGMTHAVWQESDAAGYYSVAASRDNATGQWSAPVRLDSGVDNHARPCITVDGDGYLHVLIGGHNTPLKYLRSVKAGDTAAWTPTQSFGKGTYPSLLCHPDGTLVVSVRPSGSGKGRTGADLYIRMAGATAWIHRPLVFEREPKYEGYAGYNTALAWGPEGKTLHLAADVYEGHGVYEDRGTNQLVMYMVSDDLGETWRKADGTLIEPRRYPNQLDVIAENSRVREQKMPTPVLRLGGLAVDSTGRPFVMYMSHEPTAGEVHLVTPDGEGGWREMPIAAAVERAAPGYGACGNRGGFTVTAGDELQSLIPIAPIDQFGVPGASKVDALDVRHLWVTSADGGQTFAIMRPLPETPAPRHVATVEKPTGHNTIAAGRSAGLLYVEGLHRYPRKDEVLNTKVYFVDMPVE